MQASLRKDIFRKLAEDDKVTPLIHRKPNKQDNITPRITPQTYNQQTPYAKTKQISPTHLITPPLTPNKDQNLQRLEEFYQVRSKKNNPDLPPLEEMFNVLKEKGIEPIIASRVKKDPKTNNLISEQTALLGKGAYSSAFEVDWNGKLAVLKATTSRADYQSLLFLDALKASMGKYGKHFLNVYDAFTININGIKVYFLLVEKLNPINPHVKTIVFSKDETYKPAYFSKSILNENNLRKILDANYKSLYSEIMNYFNEIEFNGLNEESENKIKEDRENAFSSLNKNKEKIINFFISSLSNIGDISFKELNRYLESDKTIEKIMLEYFPNNDKMFVNFIINRFLNIIRGAWNYVFPVYSKDHIYYPIIDKDLQEHSREERVNIFRQMPEVASIMEAIDILKEKGIEFADLHGGNIMERDNHELVFSDPGLFEFDPKYKV